MNNATGRDKIETKVAVPEFNADSAYQYIQNQVDFGPRVPNTAAHVETGKYIAQKLEEFGAKVTNQYADLIAYNGTILKARNIIGSYKPDSKKRIALFAHWDTRPWADNDLDEKNHYKPVLGANDGASGVGVLLEIARQINMQSPELGIDIIMVDAEDYGLHSREMHRAYREESWGLGSQYWARFPHVPNYNARFGILLDIVGGKGATFYKEGYSEKYAPHINKMVWKAAKELGYGNYFINEEIGAVTDDHLFVNKLIGIPTIDIIPNMVNNTRSSFSEYWHTVNDNMNDISKETLKAVGQTVMSVIYNEK
jgi:Predicted aminopeptidases